jgi:DNA-directed RNA polymerase subunit K/omega
MIERPDHMSAFEFVVVCAMRTEQLIKGSTPRVPAAHRHTTTAREEVATGLVVREPGPPSDKPLP